MINVYEFLKSKGYDIDKRWHKVTIGDLIDMLNEYQKLKRKENGGKKSEKSSK